MFCKRAEPLSRGRRLLRPSQRRVRVSVHLRTAWPALRAAGVRPTLFQWRHLRH